MAGRRAAEMLRHRAVALMVLGWTLRGVGASQAYSHLPNYRGSSNKHGAMHFFKFFKRGALQNN